MMPLRFALATALLAVLSVPALAGSPPVKGDIKRGAPVLSCLELGSKGEMIAGGQGCRNTETGAATVCTGDQCTDYSADPRYRKIKNFLETHKAKPQQRPL